MNAPRAPHRASALPTTPLHPPAPPKPQPHLPALLLAATFACADLPTASAQTPPVISRQPRSVSRSVGDKVTLSVLVTSETPSTFQWSRGDTLLPKGTNQLLNLTNLSLADAGSYRATVSNEFGTVTSEPAVLDVDGTFIFVTDTPITKESSYGVSWGDYDGDGRVDLVTAGITSVALFHNDGGGRFTKVLSPHPIPSRSYITDNLYNAVWVDYNNDGLLDYHLPTGGNWVDEADLLLRGTGGGGFETVSSPFTRQSVATSIAAWGDFNRDGWLDAFLANLGPGTASRANELWWGHADGTLTKATAEEFPGLNRRNWGASAADIDLDGDLDIVVGSNPGGGVLLYNNRGTGQFDPIILGTGDSFFGGPSFGDYDNDGLPDLFMGYLRDRSRLMHNDGNGEFSVVGNQPIAEESGRSQSGAWGDYDNDGWLDLFLGRTARYVTEGGNNDSLWHNNGDGTFTRIVAGSLGIDSVDSWGAAWADYDNDGFLDLAIGCYGSSDRLFRNGTNANHWLNLRLIGTTSNREAIGARVHLRASIGEANDRRRNQYRQVGTGNGIGAQNDIRVHFGLANATEADEIIIDWPSGKKQTLTQVPAGQFLTITEPDDRIRLAAKRSGDAGNMTLEIALTGPAGTAVLVEKSADLRAWTEQERVTLNAQGQALVRVPAAGTGATVFRASKI